MLHDEYMKRMVESVVKVDEKKKMGGQYQFPNVKAAQDREKGSSKKVSDKKEDSEMQIYSTEPSGSMVEGGWGSLEREVTGRGDIEDFGLNAHVLDSLMRGMDDYADGVPNVEKLRDQMRKSGQWLIDLANQDPKSGFVNTNVGESLSVAEMQKVCPSCARDMTEKGITAVSLDHLIDSGVLEMVDESDPAGVLIEKASGWSGRLKQHKN
jgi:hypothetical protein